MKTRLLVKFRILLALVGVLSAFGPSQSDASVIINIVESNGGVSMSVDGRIETGGLTEEALWWSAPSRTAWEGFGTGTNDMIHVLGDDAYRYSVSGVLDAGIMNVRGRSIGTFSPVTGVGYSIGTSYFGGSLSILLSGSYQGELMDYDVFFPGIEFPSLGLSDGQSRVVTFDDGTGGVESITWNVGSAVPEPSALCMIALGSIFGFRRRADRSAASSSHSIN